MSIKNVESHIDAVERKLTKSVKIAEKGDGIKLGDIIKLGQKTNSIVSELKKALAQYDVRTYLSIHSAIHPSLTPLSITR